MESQSIMSRREFEINIDMEPPHIKPEPVDDDYEETEYDEELEADAKYPLKGSGEEGKHIKIERDDDDTFPVQQIKEEIPEEQRCDDEFQEDNCEEDEDYDEHESDSNCGEEDIPNSKLTVHALPSTSTEKDNMIYFEIPVIDNTNCKCIVCGAVFEGNDKGNEYICVKCLKKKRFSPKTPVQNSEKTVPGNKQDPELSQTADFLPYPTKGRPNVLNRDRPFKCSVCQKKCISTSDLSKHKLIHSGERPYECKVCSKKFNQLSNLIRHKATHSDVKPFQCSICNKTFTQASYLKKHNLIHSGEKPYGCLVCLKRFSDYSTLSKHKLIHSGEKPFGCGICLKNFNQLASLRRHEVIHRDEKPFHCNICMKKFAQSHHLKRHQSVHRVKFVNMSLPKYRNPKPKPGVLENNRVANRTGDEANEITYEMIQNIGNEINNQLNRTTNIEISHQVNNESCRSEMDNRLSDLGVKREIDHNK